MSSSPPDGPWCRSVAASGRRAATRVGTRLARPRRPKRPDPRDLRWIEPDAVIATSSLQGRALAPPSPRQGRRPRCAASRCAPTPAPPARRARPWRRRASSTSADRDGHRSPEDAAGAVRSSRAAASPPTRRSGGWISTSNERRERSPVAQRRPGVLQRRPRAGAGPRVPRHRRQREGGAGQVLDDPVVQVPSDPAPLGVGGVDRRHQQPLPIRGRPGQSSRQHPDDRGGQREQDQEPADGDPPEGQEDLALALVDVGRPVVDLEQQRFTLRGPDLV